MTNCKQLKLKAKIGGEIAKNIRKDIETKLGEVVVTKENLLDYQYGDDVNLIENNGK